MSFRSPIVAGNVLVRNAIQSPNYVSGSAGWIIRRDGSAEFSNAVFRGSVVISGSNTLLMYSAAPAVGDLVISVAPNAGTDSYGNVYPAGFQVLNHGGANASGIAISFAGTQPLMYFLNAVPNIKNDPALLVNAVGTGTAEYAAFVISSGEDSTQTDYVAIQLDSSSADGSSHVAVITDNYVDTAGGVHPMIQRGPGGTTIYAGSIAAVQPGTGTSRANLATGETWHAPSLATNWTTGTAPNPPLKYRAMADSGGVKIFGYAAYTGTPGAGTLVFTLPTGYFDSTYVFVSGGGWDTHNSAQVPIEVSTTGAVTLQKGAGLTANIFFDVTVYPGF